MARSKSKNAASSSKALPTLNEVKAATAIPTPPPPLAKGASSIYEVVDLPGRGKGMIATRDIKASFAFACCAACKTEFEENPIQTRKFLKDKMSNLTADQRAEYMSLWYEPATPTQDVLRAILMANSYSTHDSLAVFPNAARMNHGCAGASNVAYSWRKGEGRFYLHALRGVKQGEELLSAYLDPKMSRSERRKVLKEKYRFDCNCSSCSLPEALSLKSDRRLSNINGLFECLMGWNTNMLSGKQVVEIVNKIWELAEEENLSTQFGELAGLGAMVAAAHSE
ncbi:hypothetical protein FRC04_012291 [Tulasnella sp. 424]|nr:hypothetical protein FRC04_012291 [Tulasnella sp. 424]